jgi:hypothetical protein
MAQIYGTEACNSIMRREIGEEKREKGEGRRRPFSLFPAFDACGQRLDKGTVLTNHDVQQQMKVECRRKIIPVFSSADAGQPRNCFVISVFCFLETKRNSSTLIVGSTTIVIRTKYFNISRRNVEIAPS